MSLFAPKNEEQVRGREKARAPAVGGEENKVLSGNEIREMFLRFFEGKGHKRLRSSSLVPHGDPTLLFTNAGMNQFKDVFLGLEKRSYSRATTAQKCVRAGGKHNDLENVGFTKRHHTFFEMLGNFSFGDYFKKDAIAYAWELITSPQWFGIAKDKLYVTIFDDPDKAAAFLELGFDVERDREAEKHWLDVGVPKDRIFGGGRKDNFWQMGDTGPCGPCSELHYDMGTSASELGHGTTAPECKFPCDCGRFVEIWNLVFMQYDRQQGGTRLLPKPCVDTGMGLERVAAVLQGVISNYDTDLFVLLMKRAAELCGVDFEREEKLEEGKGGAASLRVIADHARATTFLIADGVLPSNEGRGYVLRKITRRAIRHGRLLGATQPFFTEMIVAVRALMHVAYPELFGPEAAHLLKAINEEEKRFGQTLDVGLKKLELSLRLAPGMSYVDELVGSNKIEPPDADSERYNLENILLATEGSHRLFAGSVVVGDNFAPELIRRLTSPLLPGVRLRGSEAFRLYETYGLPRDFIEDATRDQGQIFDSDGFDRALEAEQAQARASWKGGAKESADPVYAKTADSFRTELDFYSGTTAKDCKIIAFATKDGAVQELKLGESGNVILDRTAIYAESGGQVADTGAFYDNSESQLLAEVTGAFYPVAGLVAHKVVAKETLRVGDRVVVVADADRRARIIRNHTGTHLVNAALRNILGIHVKQSGSLNAPDRLRFDFSHFAHVGAEELGDIEQQVNDEIRLNTQVETSVTSLEEALNSGALAFFGDKYPESNVRVVTIPDPRSPRGFYSKELCGGTHVERVGDIGVLKIVGEESVAAGVRRIEAVTGIGALEHYQRAMETLRGVAQLLHVGDEHILMRINELAEKTAALEKDLEAAKRLQALLQIGDLDALIRESRERVSKEALVRGNSTVQLVKGTKVAWSQVQDVDKEQLREIMDKLRQEIKSGVVVLASVQDGSVSLIAAVTKDLTTKVHAGKLIGAL